MDPVVVVVVALRLLPDSHNYQAKRSHSHNTLTLDAIAATTDRVLFRLGDLRVSWSRLTDSILAAAAAAEQNIIRVSFIDDLPKAAEHYSRSNGGQT